MDLPNKTIHHKLIGLETRVVLYYFTQYATMYLKNIYLNMFTSLYNLELCHKEINFTVDDCSMIFTMIVCT